MTRNVQSNPFGGQKDDHTPDQGSVQAKDRLSAHTPKDYYDPVPNRTIESDLAKQPLSARLEDRLENIRKNLTVHEDLLLTWVFRDNINQAYYDNWLKDVNGLHMLAIKTRRRLKALKKP
jgi:hypothetical protein